MFLLRNQVAASGFALLAMTMRASVESFVKIRPNSFDSTNSFHNLCSNHRGTEVTEERQKPSFGFKKRKRDFSCVFFSVFSVSLW